MRLFYLHANRIFNSVKSVGFVPRSAVGFVGRSVNVVFKFKVQVYLFRVREVETIRTGGSAIECRGCCSFLKIAIMIKTSVCSCDIRNCRGRRSAVRSRDRDFAGIVAEGNVFFCVSGDSRNIAFSRNRSKICAVIDYSRISGNSPGFIRT